MASPVKLSHYVLQTNQVPVLRDWYLKVLNAEIVHENAMICFLCYDDEHHRIAFLDMGPLERKPERMVGLNHVAFTFATLGDLLGTYERLKRDAITPHWCINHGPTTSLYYHDPDGNGVELEVDNFADVADCKRFMRGADFAENVLGVEFDPDRLVERFRAGVPAAELLDRARLELALA